MAALRILYGDVFRIADQVVLFFGAGKTRGAQRASGGRDEDAITFDFVAVNSEDGETLVSADLPLAGAPPEFVQSFEERRQWIPLDWIAYCLNEEETVKFFDAKARPREVRPVNEDGMRKLARGNVLTGVAETDVPARLAAFDEVLTGGGLKGLVGVPWCESVEEKGDLMREFFERAKET